MPSSDPSVSFVVVIAGEPEDRVAEMLAAAAAQHFPQSLELVVAAPAADLARLAPVLTTWTRGPLVPVANPGGSRTRGLNAAVDAATGTYLVRVDARSRPPAEYVRRCVARLAGNAGIGMVGGHQHPQAPAGAGVVRRGIARALRNRFLLGAAAYRTPGASGPVDTVYLGVFRRADVATIRYDETLTANEDYDLCARFDECRMTVFLEPDLAVDYEPRATWPSLLAQYHAFGRAKVAYWRARGSGPRGRQRVAIGVATAVAVGGTALAVRWPISLAVLALAIIAGYATSDRVADPSPASIGERAAAIPAHVAIQLGWLSGIGRGLLDRHSRRRTSSGDVEHPLQRDAGQFRGGVVDDDLVDHLAAGE